MLDIYNGPQVGEHNVYLVLTRLERNPLCLYTFSTFMPEVEIQEVYYADRETFYLNKMKCVHKVSLKLRNINLISRPCFKLTEHVCKLSVTSSGQWAPICFKASSSSCGGD